MLNVESNMSIYFPAIMMSLSPPDALAIILFFQINHLNQLAFSFIWLGHVVTVTGWEEVSSNANNVCLCHIGGLVGYLCVTSASSKIGMIGTYQFASCLHLLFFLTSCCSSWNLVPHIREVLPGAGCSLVRIKRFCSWLNLRPTCALGPKALL